MATTSFRPYAVVSLLIIFFIQPSISIYCDEDDCYDLLGVSQNANSSEIKRAYYKLSLKHHPDKNPDPESKKLFVKIANAYEILKDEVTRGQYDYAIEHPEEVFYNTARYYHAYYGHKTDPRAVLVGLLLVLSGIQYLNQWTRYHQAIDMVKRTPAYKNKLKALELERTGAISSKKKGGYKIDKKMQEDISKELELQIKGAEKPSVWGLLGVRFILLPYTLGKLLLWHGCWYWRYKINKTSYSLEDASYLTSFWARTESGIFRAVLKAHPSFDEVPWPTLSSEAKDFVKRLLNKDPRKRMTAAQALSHPWIRNTNDVKVPLDVSMLRHMKNYMRSSALRKAAIRALVKTLGTDELFYLKEQFSLLEPSKTGSISMENIKTALLKHATDAMKESRVHDFLTSLNALQYRRMEFDEFCAAALSVHQLEALDRWEETARSAYEIFDKDGNRAIMIDELASELGLGPSVPVHSVLHDWIRHTDGKLSFLGFVKLLHGVSTRTLAKTR